MKQFLYNSEGAWIAFRLDGFVYDRDGRWIGWLPWHNGEVVDTEGHYLATIVEGNRLYRDEDWAERDFPGYPGRATDFEPVEYPGFAGSASLPAHMTDVSL